MQVNYQKIVTQQNTQCVTLYTAIETARKFLEQYYSPVVFKYAVFKETSLVVIMDIGIMVEKIKQVEIDIQTGQVIWCA